MPGRSRCAGCGDQAKAAAESRISIQGCGPLLALVEPDERGDPMSPPRWTMKSPRTLAQELVLAGHNVSADNIADLLREEGFTLQANVKTIEGGQHPDRDAQFRYFNAQAYAHRNAGQPVISVDTKKKELVGEFKNGGRQRRLAGDPAPVNLHDFADPKLGKAIPYGVYDVAANTGWVNVGTDHDTATFAVESIRRWRSGRGQASYPQAAPTLPAPGLEARTRPAHRRNRAKDHRLSPASGHIEVEQDRAPAVLARPSPPRPAPACAAWPSWTPTPPEWPSTTRR